MTRLAGRWRITEMDMWDREAIDLIGPGFIEFAKNGTGQFRFIAVHGGMDCRRTKHDGKPTVEFSWDGDDEGDHISGRGWATLTENGTLEGHLFIHMGDDSSFRAMPFAEADATV